MKSDQIYIVNQYIGSKDIDGFNLLIGMPKWRERAIEAGSTVGLKFKNITNSNDLLKKMKLLEEQGIGERINEGYGRIAFNHPVRTPEVDLNTSIRIPEQLRINGPHTTILDSSLQEWNRFIEDKLKIKKIKDQEWGALAFWINSKINNIAKNPDELKNFHIIEDSLKVNLTLTGRDLYFEKKENKKILQEIIKKFSKIDEIVPNTIQDIWRRNALESLASEILSRHKEGRTE